MKISTFLIFLILYLGISSCSYEEPVILEKNSQDYLQPYLDRVLNDHIYEIAGNNTIKISINYDYEVEEFLTDGDYITANACVDGETYKRIYNKELEKIEEILNLSKEEIINSIIDCMERLKIAKLSAFSISYGDIEVVK